MKRNPEMPSRISKIKRFEWVLMIAYFVITSFFLLVSISTMFISSDSSSWLFLHDNLFDFFNNNILIFFTSFISSIFVLIVFPRRVKAALFNNTNEITKAIMEFDNRKSSDSLDVLFAYEDIFIEVFEFYNGSSIRKFRSEFLSMSEYLDSINLEIFNNKIKVIDNKEANEKIENFFRYIAENRFQIILMTKFHKTRLPNFKIDIDLSNKEYDIWNVYYKGSELISKSMVKGTNRQIM